jgi:hypothetical protein
MVRYISCPVIYGRYAEAGIGQEGRAWVNFGHGVVFV